MSETNVPEFKAEIEEVTPRVELPVKLFAEPKPLTKEERQEYYAKLRMFADAFRLPLPEEFWDDDVTSECGQNQLEMDAHMVGLLNKGLITMSPEKEKQVRERLKKKIALVRKLKGLPEKVELEDLPADESDCHSP